MQREIRVISPGNDFTFPVGPITDIDGSNWPGTQFNAYVSDTRESPVALGAVVLVVPIVPGSDTLVTFDALQVNTILAASARVPLADGTIFWCVVESAGDFLRVGRCVYRAAIEAYQ